MKKKKHKHSIERFTTYESGDCYYYHAECKTCKFKVGAWTEKKCEELLLTDGK